GLGDIEDGIDDIAQASLARPPAPRRRWQVGLDHSPLFVRGIACVAQPVALILAPRDFSPGHGVTPRCLRKHERESPPLKSRNPRSGSSTGHPAPGSAGTVSGAKPRAACIFPLPPTQAGTIRLVHVTARRSAWPAS